MRDIAYGTYKDGQVLLDTPSPMIREARVQIIFLDEKKEKDSLMDMFDVLGPWEDDRDTEAIIAEIRSARISGPDIRL